MTLNGIFCSIHRNEYTKYSREQVQRVVSHSVLYLAARLFGGKFALKHNMLLQ